MNKYFEELEAKMGAAAIEQGKAFLEENKKKPGVVTLPSGLQYEVINEGTGKKAKATDQVKCHYEGTLIMVHCSTALSSAENRLYSASIR